MEAALYLLPTTLGDTPIEKVLPAYNKEVILGIKHFIVEEVRTARRFLKKVDSSINIDELTFYPLNKHTSPEEISGYLKPLLAGSPMGVISEAARIYSRLHGNGKLVGIPVPHVVSHCPDSDR